MGTVTTIRRFAKLFSQIANLLNHSIPSHLISSHLSANKKKTRNTFMPFFNFFFFLRHAQYGNIRNPVAQCTILPLLRFNDEHDGRTEKEGFGGRTRLWMGGRGGVRYTRDWHFSPSFLVLLNQRGRRRQRCPKSTHKDVFSLLYSVVEFHFG